MSTASDISMNMLLAIVLAPLFGAILAGLFGRKIGRASAHGVTIPAVAVQAHVGFMIDKLTAMMMVVVTFVSLLVHVYTIGYMADDDGYQRFFSYIRLFTFRML